MAQAVLVRQRLVIDRQVAERNGVGQLRRLAQRRGHAVDGVDQVLDLVVRPDGYFVVEVADRHRVQRDADPLQPLRHDRADPQRAGDGDQERDRSRCEQHRACVCIGRIALCIRLGHFVALALDHVVDEFTHFLGCGTRRAQRDLPRLHVLVLDRQRDGAIRGVLIPGPLIPDLGILRAVDIVGHRGRGSDQFVGAGPLTPHLFQLAFEDLRIVGQREALFGDHRRCRRVIELLDAVQRGRRVVDQSAHAVVDRAHLGNAEGDYPGQ